MTQREIKRLLERAAVANKEERSNIFEKFLSEATSGVSSGGVHFALFQMARELYWRTLRSAPDYLIKLLPFFVLLCGKRKNDHRCLLAERVGWGKIW